MIRYRYNQQVAPPARFVHVTIRRPVDETSVRDILRKSIPPLT